MKRYWFCGKLYGWGWTPITWEGWLATVIFAAVIIAATLLFTFLPATPVNTFMVSGALLAVTALMLILCYFTGEKPRFRWGKRD